METQPFNKPIPKRSKSASTRIGGRIMRKRAISKLKNRSSSRKKIVEKSSSALKKKIMHSRAKEHNHGDRRPYLAMPKNPEEFKKLETMRQVELSLMRNKPRTQLNLEKRLKGFIKEIAGIDESLRRMMKNIKHMSRFSNTKSNNDFFVKMVKSNLEELKLSRDHFIKEYDETKLEYDPVPKFSFFSMKNNKLWFETELKQKSVSSNEESQRSRKGSRNSERDIQMMDSLNNSTTIDTESMEDSREDTHNSARTSLMGPTSVEDDNSDSSMLALSEYYSGDSYYSSVKDTDDGRMTNLEVIPEHDNDCESSSNSSNGDGDT